MELRHLRYFVAVAEELHFGRAAIRLGMAQPPLSQQIRQLEGELGVQLLSRTRRRVELTDAGRVFLVAAHDILARAGAAIEAARRAQRGEIGALRVGFAGSAAYEVMPLMVRAYRDRYRDVDVTLREMTTLEQIDALQGDRLDVGFARMPVSNPALAVEVVRREPFLVALPEGHPLTMRDRIPARALADEPFILLPRHWQSGFYDAVIAYCHAQGFSPHVLQEATEFHTIVGLVAAGLGVSLVPAAVSNLRGRGVAYRQLEGEPPQAELAIIWRKNDISRVLGAFLAVVRELAAGMPDGPEQVDP
ncbi:MAG TPA: LysR family transcriptional regulator [Ktedonobacterales bacterium]|nr:LysR family transcriptional regulator [Ktedonobacterales bacterium]